MTIRHIAVAAAALAVVSTAYLAGRHAVYAQTQAEMTAWADHDYVKADKKLNAVYQQVLKKTSDEYTPATKRKLIASERAWIAYRDAESHYEASVGGEGGTIYPNIFALTATDLTEERTKLLKDMLTRN